jgi:hypothetical protein
MKTERRWMKSVLAAASGPVPAMPWERGNRRRPEAFARTPPQPVARPAATRPALAAR